MKKFIFTTIAMAVLCLGLFTGCSYSTDRSHAAVTISTSRGTAASYATYNGLNMTHSGEDIATKYPIKVFIHDGESVHVKLWCSSCECEKKYEFTSFGAELISCDCPLNDEENGRSKEFACVLVCAAEEQVTSTTTTIKTTDKTSISGLSTKTTTAK